jgi:hypothetical protein
MKKKEINEPSELSKRIENNCKSFQTKLKEGLVQKNQIKFCETIKNKIK